MKRKIVFSNARKLYDMLLNIYFDDYNNITDEEKEKLGEKCNSINLLIKGQRCIGLKKEKKSKSQPEETIAEGVKSRRQKADDKDLFDVP